MDAECLRQALHGMGGEFAKEMLPIHFHVDGSPHTVLRGVRSADGSWQLSPTEQDDADSALLIRGPLPLIVAFLESKEEGFQAAKRGLLDIRVNPKSPADAFFVLRKSFRANVVGFSSTNYEDNGGIREEFLLAPLDGFTISEPYTIAWSGDPKFYNPNTANPLDYRAGQVQLHNWNTVSTALISSYFHRIPLMFHVSETTIVVDPRYPYRNFQIWSVTS